MTSKSYKVVDGGYGYLKWPNDKGEVEKEQAVVAILGESLNDGDLKGVDILTVDNTKYIIGEDVYKLNQKPITANENAKRAQNVAYKIMLLYALAKSADRSSEEIVFLTGLPYQNLDEAEMVKELFTKEHDIALNGKKVTLNIVDTKVMSQGLGSFYSLVKQRGSKVLSIRVLLVDLGFRTINYIPIDSGNIDVNKVLTNPELGIQDAYKEIVKHINIEFKSNFKFYDVDDLLDKGVPVQDLEKGSVRTQIKDRDYVHAALQDYANDVWSDLVDKYGDKYREQLQEVVFSGGTAERVKDYLEKAKRHYCSTLDDPQDAQVLGYQEIANQLERQQVKA